MSNFTYKNVAAWEQWAISDGGDIMFLNRTGTFYPLLNEHGGMYTQRMYLRLV
jgi:hypothetical protein